MTAAPLILNFDGSVGDIKKAMQIDLSYWQESVRFGAMQKTYREFMRQLDHQMPSHYGTVLLGSGDYHHLSLYLIERCAAKGPFQIIVFDNHPDNMRFPFGIHCGSWVRRVAMLPHVSHVHVVGITSRDISVGAVWEQYGIPFLHGKLTYWSTQVDVSWARYVGLSHAFRSFASPDELIAMFLHEVPRGPTYLSIDKDVLSPAVVRTNWDQGLLYEKHIMQVIVALHGQIIGSDITGEVSLYRYQTWWKKLLSTLDGQKKISPRQLQAWQTQQFELNQRFLSAIANSSVT